jgi:hypothetical protein
MEFYTTSIIISTAEDEEQNTKYELSSIGEWRRAGKRDGEPKNTSTVV